MKGLLVTLFILLTSTSYAAYFNAGYSESCSISAMRESYTMELESLPHRLYFTIGVKERRKLNMRFFQNTISKKVEVSEYLPFKIKNIKLKVKGITSQREVGTQRGYIWYEEAFIKVEFEKLSAEEVNKILLELGADPEFLPNHGTESFRMRLRRKYGESKEFELSSPEDDNGLIYYLKISC